ERNQSGHENDWGKAPRTRELPVLQHHRHLPKPVLVVLAKDASQRSTWRVVNVDRRVEDDPSPGQPNTKAEFVVLVPPQRLPAVTRRRGRGGRRPRAATLRKSRCSSPHVLRVDRSAPSASRTLPQGARAGGHLPCRAGRNRCRRKGCPSRMRPHVPLPFSLRR